MFLASSPLLQALGHYITGIRLLNFETVFAEQVTVEERRFNRTTIYRGTGRGETVSQQYVFVVHIRYKT